MQQRIHFLEQSLENQAGELKNSEESRRQLEQEMSVLVCTLRCREADRDLRDLLKDQLVASDIGQYFIGLCTSEKKASDSSWRDLEKEVNRLFEGFSKRLLGQGLMKQHEFRICMLIKLGLPVKSIAHLVNLSPEGVTSIRRRLCSKFSLGVVDPKSWDDFIRSL